ncbi:MAG TPA: hypothetical protein DHU55_14595 [Blastocatellia bacterium]|nr:hypothetical protein [Blastocatellia bacterium]HCX30975.1 hypothetical protein [Blastocatellia bacterium]
MMAACFTACLHWGQSSFFASFSLRQLVEKNKIHPGLDCGAGGGAGIGGGSGFFGTKESHSHKAEDFSCRLKADRVESFDEANLIAALKQDVERDLGKSGAKIVDSGSADSRSFFFLYILNKTQGRVEVSGKRIGEDYYTLKADLDEKTIATVK